MAGYKLPESIKIRYNDMRNELEVQEDLMRRLKIAGMSDPELEIKITQLRDRLDKFARAFDLPVK